MTKVHPIPSRQPGKSPKPEKPDRPYKDFPLFPHATRRWAKKIKGKMHYFGPWDDADGALKKYTEQRDDLFAGRTPRVSADGFAVRDLLNRFLNSKRHLVDTRELTPRSFADYHATCTLIGSTFGLSRLVSDLAADDFEKMRKSISERLGPVALGNQIQRIRTVFKYAYDAGLIVAPVRYGPGFKRPSKKVLRQARIDAGPRMFEAAELRAMLKDAGPQIKAMILLGINCGYGNNDVATMPMKALDLGRGWATYPRPKTAIERRCPLWPETVAAIKIAIKARTEPEKPEDADLVFVTVRGNSWAKDARIKESGKMVVDNPLTKEMTKLLKRLDIHRPGLGFYALRHTLETIGGAARDQIALDHIMGHAREDMASVYRERIDDERLQVVVKHVRGWLFKKAK